MADENEKIGERSEQERVSGFERNVRKGLGLANADDKDCAIAAAKAFRPLRTDRIEIDAAFGGGCVLLDEAVPTALDRLLQSLGEPRREGSVAYVVRPIRIRYHGMFHI